MSPPLGIQVGYQHQPKLSPLSHPLPAHPFADPFPSLPLESLLPHSSTLVLQWFLFTSCPGLGEGTLLHQLLTFSPASRLNELMPNLYTSSNPALGMGPACVKNW